MTHAFRGEGKTDSKDARVIAETALSLARVMGPLVCHEDGTGLSGRWAVW
jgi:hypothetical protein